MRLTRGAIGRIVMTGFAVVSIIWTAGFAIAPARAATGVARVISYQGRLVDSTGLNVADGVYNLKIVIYDSIAGGNCLWSAKDIDANAATADCGSVSALAVTVTGGLFTVNLGDTTAGQNTLPTSIFSDDTRYLGVTVNTDAEMSPRRRLTAVYQSLNSLLLNSLATSAVGGASAFVPVTDGSGNLLLTQSLTVGTGVTVGNTTLSGNSLTSTGILNISADGGSDLVLSAGSGAVHLGAGTNEITNTDLGANLVLSATGDIKIKDGEVLILGSLPADPVGSVNGSEYYNTVTNNRRCFTGGVWGNCNSAGFVSVGSVTSLVNANNQVGIGTSTPVTGTRLQVVQSDAVNNDITNVVTFDHVTSGTAAAGIGIGTNYRTQNDFGTITDAGHLNAFLTNATSGNEASAFSFGTRTGGGPVTERLRITAAGLTPALTNNTEDLGGAGNQWRSAYLGTSTIINANTTLADGSLGTASGNFTLQAAGTGTGSIKIGTGGAGSTTPDLLALDVKSDAGDPAGANGDMYYNANTNTFRCFTNGSWSNCDTTGGTATLQSAYNAGATIITASATDIAFTLTSGNFTASGAGSVNLTPTGASSFTSAGALTLTGGAASTWSTSSGALTLTSAAAATWGTAVGNLSLQAAGTGTTANVQIGVGGGGSATPDLFVLDVKSTAGDPTGTAGAVYYSVPSGRLRCYENGAWVNCTGSSLSSITAATSANSINNGDFAQTWNWSLTTPNQVGLALGENVASTATGDASIVNVSALAGSTATPLVVKNFGEGDSFRVDDEPGDTSPFVITKTGQVGIGTNTFVVENTEKLKVETVLGSSRVIAGYGDLNAPIYFDVRNRNSGAKAASAYSANASDGTDTMNFLSVGITSPGFSDPAYAIAGPHDSFVFNVADLTGTHGGNLIIGTIEPGMSIKFVAGGGADVTNEQMRIDGAGNVGIHTTSPGSALDVKGTLRLSGATSGFVGLSPAAAAGSTTYTLPSADGTAGQALTTNGAGVLSWVSPTGVWQRVGTTLSPATSGDSVTTSGNVTTTGTGAITAAGLLTGAAGLTASGAVVSLNDSSNFNTTINTGSSTGAVTIGNSSAGAITITAGAASTWGTSAGNLILQAAGTGTGSIKIGTGGAGSTTPDLLALDVKSDAGDPAGANGDMYYNANTNTFRCFTNGSWSNCDTTGGTATLQSAYNAGATIITASATDIAFTLTSGNFTASGAGSVNLTPTGASSFTSAGALTLTGGAASTWGTSAGNLTLQAAGTGTTANVQIGVGGAGSTTPDLLALDVKSDAGDPAGSNGEMYYSASTNSFRCFTNGGWQDCGATAASATTLQQAYTAGSTITTTGSNVALVLTSGNFTASGAGSVNLTPTGASSFTSAGALTLTSGAAAVWSTSVGALTVDAAAALNLGTTNATAVSISKTGVTTTINGALTSTQTLTASNGLTQTTGALNLTATSGALALSGLGASSINTGANSLSFVGAPININTTGTGTVNLGSATAAVNLPGLTASKVVFTDASNNLTSTGTVAIAQGGTGQTTKTTAFDALSPLTTKGDVIAYNGTSNVRIPIGSTNGFVLTIDGTQAAGVKWAASLPAANSLDFAQFSDAMTVDANTSIALASKNLTINDVAGTGVLTLAPGGALTLTGGAASTWSTAAGNLTLQAGSGTVSLGTSTSLTAAGALGISVGAGTALTLTSQVAATWGTTAGNLTITAAGGGTGNVQIGLGAGTATPNLLVVDSKSTAGDPAGTNGAMYYNASAGNLRCYIAGAWQDCPGTWQAISGVNQMKVASQQLQVGATPVPAGVKADISLSDAANNASSTILVLDHATTGTAGNGIGANLLFRNQNDAGTITNAGDISAFLDNVANGTEDSSLRFFTRAGGGALAEHLRITNVGNLLPGSTDNTLDLGTATNRWHTLKLGTSAVIGGTTLSDGTLASTGTLNLNSGGSASVTVSSASGSLLFAAGTNQLRNTDSADIIIHATRNLKVDDSSLLSLSVKAADPAAPPSVNGAIYYNSGTNKFRCYQNSAWTDCVTGGTLTGTGTNGQLAFWTGSTTQSGDANLFWDNTAKALGIGTSTIHVGVKLETETTDGLTNGISNVAAFEHNTTGTAANGLGVGILLRGQNDSGTEFAAARVSGVMTNVATGSETGALVLDTYSAGALAERLRLTSAGNLTFAQASTVSTSTGTLAIDSAAALNLGTSAAASVSLGKTGITTTNNGALTVTQTLTANGNVTMTTANITGASPLVFDGATVDTNKITFAITDPTAARTITFPNASGTVAVSATGPIAIDAAGNVTCSACVTTPGARLDQITAATGTNTIANANFAQVWNWGTLTTQTGITLGGGTAMTTGSILALNAGTYVHTTAEAGSLATLTVTDASTNASGVSTTNGIIVNSTYNTSGAGTKDLNAISVSAPTLTGCASGACVWDGYEALTQATGAAATITQNAMHITAAGIAAGSLNGLAIDNLTAGAGAETAIKIGTGWDQGLTIGVTPSATTGRTIDVAGNWGGNAVVDVQLQTAAATTVTESTKALVYYLTLCNVTTTCTTGNGTQGAAPVATFNITGLPDTDGTFAFIETQVTRIGVGGGANENATIIVQINGAQISTVTTGTGNADSGTIIENYTVVRSNGVWRVTGGTGTSDTADLAEWIPYSGDQPLAGELVTVDSSNPVTVKRSAGADDRAVIGVVSTLPHTSFGKDDGHSVLLTLAGRIPVKISNENGEVKTGDYLTASSTPGVAMKATKPGMVIGQVLAPTNGDDNTKAIMLVKNTYFPGNGPILEEVLGSATSLADLPNGITPYVLDLQNEAPVDPLATFSDRLANGFKLATNFVAARVTAIRGYFDETFANKSHQKTLCVGDVGNGGELCVTKDQLQQLLTNQNSSQNSSVQQNINAPSAPPPPASASSSASADSAAIPPVNAPSPAETVVQPPPTDTSSTLNVNTPPPSDSGAVTAPVPDTPSTPPQAPTDTPAPTPVETPAVTATPVAQ